MAYSETQKNSGNRLRADSRGRSETDLNSVAKPAEDTPAAPAAEKETPGTASASSPSILDEYDDDDAFQEAAKNDLNFQLALSLNILTTQSCCV